MVLGLLISFASATFSTEPIEWFDFEGDTESISGYTWPVEAGTAAYTTGKFGSQALIMNGDDALKSDTLFKNNASICWFIKMSANPNLANVFSQGTVSSNLLYSEASGTQTRWVENDGTPAFTTTFFTLSLNNWHSICLSYNSSDDFTVYYNGIFDEAEASTSYTKFPFPGARIGSDWNGDGHINAAYDDFCSWDETITPTDVAEFDSNGCAGAPPVDTTPPTINYTTPQNNSIVNDIPLLFIINVTDDFSLNQSCFLRNESDLLDANSDVVQDVFTTLTYTTASNQISTNTFNITCFDNSPANNSAQLLLSISVDTLNPILTINNPLNNSVFNKAMENISYNVGCNDNNPFLLNFTLFDSNNANVFSVQNATAVSSNLNLTGAVDISSFNSGNYTGNFSCSDTHTAKEIPNYSYVKDLSRKMFYFNTGNNIINITMLSKPAAFELTELYVNKNIDSYGFSYIGETGTPLSTYRFILTTKQPLIYIKYSGYDAHFISGNNWIDFENNDKNAKYSVKRLSKYKYQITIITNDLNFMSIGGLNVVVIEHNYRIIANAAVNHFEFIVPDFELDSSELITVFNGSINLTGQRHVSFKGSGILEKITSPQSTATTGILLVNGVELFSGEIISTDDIISFNLPIKDIELVSGQNNISLQVSEDSTGAIRVTNLIIEGDIDTSTNGTLTHNHKSAIKNVSSATFVNILNISINKTFNSSTHIDIHDKVTKISGASSTNSLCYAINNITNERTIVYERWLQSNGDTGNTGTNYITKTKTTGSERWDLFCSVDDSDIIEHNIDLYLLEMIDDNENTISNLQNESTEIQPLTAGTTKIGGYENYAFVNATQINIMVTIIAQSTSAQQNGDNAPSFKLNASGVNESVCSSSGNRRGFVSNSDIATIKFYMDCNSEMGEIISLNLFATVEPGETLNILNTTISGFEVNERDLFEVNIRPMVIIKNPLNNQKINRTVTINFSVTDFNDDNFLINITITNSTNATDITLIASDLHKGIVNFTFNFSNVNLGNYNLSVIAFENESAELLSSSTTIIIENIFPVINVTLLAPINNSVIRRQNIDFSYITDVNSNCSFYLNMTLNRSMQALAGTNTFENVRLSNMTWLWNINCTNSSLVITGNSKVFTVHVNLIQNLLDLTECPSTTAGMLTLLMVIGISLFFIFLGFMFKNGMVGFFGAILLMICSWYIAACLAIFAYIIALFSFVLMIWFVVSGIGFENKTFK